MDEIIVISTRRETKIAARNLPQATEHKYALENLQKGKETAELLAFLRGSGCCR